MGIRKFPWTRYIPIFLYDQPDPKTPKGCIQVSAGHALREQFSVKGGLKKVVKLLFYGRLDDDHRLQRYVLVTSFCASLDL